MKSKGTKAVSSKGLDHGALLKLVKVSNLISSLADSFFLQYKTTDAEFNILMTLNNFSPDGLSQKELSEELVIKKSNLVGIIDKLEEREFVQRNKNLSDRRLNKIVLTKAGKNFIKEIEDDYFNEVKLLMDNLEKDEKEILTSSMLKLIDYLKERLKESK